MNQPLHYQLRVYFDEAQAERVRHGEVPEPLAALLRTYEATMVNQLAAFEAFVAQAERDGDASPLYKWTKATVQDPAMRAKHGTAFAIRVRDAEVYDKADADAIEASLRPLVASGTVPRMSRHDTSPATNIPVPQKYFG